MSLAAPWLSQLEVESAAHVWPRAPAVAYARLEDAAKLNPLSDGPYLVAGSIALRLDDLARAEHDFSLALGRTPGDAYATLELGAIASTQGQRARSAWPARTGGALNPRDRLTREALDVAREGRRVDIQALNRSILLKARRSHDLLDLFSPAEQNFA